VKLLGKDKGTCRYTVRKRDHNHNRILLVHTLSLYSNILKDLNNLYLEFRKNNLTLLLYIILVDNLLSTSIFLYHIYKDNLSLYGPYNFFLMSLFIQLKQSQR
jgi:hypothetical protein